MSDKNAIEIKDILTEILSCFQQMAQWAQSCNFDNVAGKKAAAESLIALVEVHDCRSIGGFSKGQRESNISPMKYESEYHALYARWMFLADKYGYNEDDVDRQWRPVIEKMFKRRR